MIRETITVHKMDAKGEFHNEEMPFKVWESIGAENNKAGWIETATAPREVVELKSKNAVKEVEVVVESVVEEEIKVVGSEKVKPTKKK